MYINKRSIFGLTFVVFVVILGFLNSAKEYVLTCDVKANTCNTFRKNYSGREVFETHTAPYDVKNLKIISRVEHHSSRHGRRTTYYYDVCFVDKSDRVDCFYTAGSESAAETISADLKRIFSECKGCSQIKYDLKNKVQR
ncbi:MAG: hypothetical protein VZR09_03385 [Candidatus Gastranaerophilaceae bacterium]|nr:hypothetical protein [Candidatus Gastranaerophilaceae bacterium]